MPFMPLKSQPSVRTTVLAMIETTSMTMAWKSRRAGRSANDPTIQASAAPAAAATIQGSGNGSVVPKMYCWKLAPVEGPRVSTPPSPGRHIHLDKALPPQPGRADQEDEGEDDERHHLLQ